MESTPHLKNHGPRVIGSKMRTLRALDPAILAMVGIDLLPKKVEKLS